MNDVVPFGSGTRSTAYADANIQYMDFLSYLKDVFNGDNSIAYTFSKTLGGGGTAVFSYYLSSPFNVLVLFFAKENLLTCFTIIVMLKLATAAASMAIFLTHRFRGLAPFMTLALAVSYGLMQYSIAQSENIMWLDGVIMLPLILLGTWRLVHANTVALLALCIALSTLFNWYTGLINCLFSGLFFLVELAWRNRAVRMETVRRHVVNALGSIGLYAVTAISGLCMSMVLLLPTLRELSGGRDELDWKSLKNAFRGNPVSVVQGTILGSTSSPSTVSLYCGSLALLGCLAFLVCKSMDARTRIIGAAFLFLLVMTCYWQPLFWLFSLGKSATSYWYRYSYGVIAGIIFLAARYFAHTKERTGGNGALLLNIAAWYSAALLVLEYVKPQHDVKHVFYTIAVWCAVAACIYWLGKRTNRTFMRRLLAFVILVAVCFELFFNAKMLLATYTENATTPSRYVSATLATQRQIDAIQATDRGVYRISRPTPLRSGAAYNTAAAFSYWSVAGYTSDPDNQQRRLLQNLGYRMNGENFNVTDYPILATDSLLGVKYYISSTPLTGLRKRGDLPNAVLPSTAQSGKKATFSIYENPYALPMAFVSSADVASIRGKKNPFAYTNALYGALLGEKTDIYKPLSYTVETKEGSIFYHLSGMSDTAPAYANFPDLSTSSKLTVNGKAMWLASWGSPSVFPIAADQGSNETTIVMHATQGGSNAQPQFYALDLAELAIATELLTAHAPSRVHIDNGSAQFTVRASAGTQTLYTSIPYDSNWSLTVNGKSQAVERYADALIAIPLAAGRTNDVQLRYRVPGIAPGVAMSLLGVAILVAEMMVVRRIKRETHSL